MAKELTKKEIIDFLERECAKNWEAVQLFDRPEEKETKQKYAAKWIELEYCLGVIKGCFEEVKK